MATKSNKNSENKDSSSHNKGKICSNTVKPLDLYKLQKKTFVQKL